MSKLKGNTNPTSNSSKKYRILPISSLIFLLIICGYILFQYNSVKTKQEQAKLIETIIFSQLKNSLDTSAYAQILLKDNTEPEEIKKENSIFKNNFLSNRQEIIPQRSDSKIKRIYSIIKSQEEDGQNSQTFVIFDTDRSGDVPYAMGDTETKNDGGFEKFRVLEEKVSQIKSPEQRELFKLESSGEILACLPIIHTPKKGSPSLINLGILVGEIDLPEEISSLIFDTKPFLQRLFIPEQIPFFFLLCLVYAGLITSHLKRMKSDTERVEKYLIEEKEKTAKITQNIPGAVYIYKENPAQNVRGFSFLSPAIENLFQISSDQAKSSWRNLTDMIPENQRQRAILEFERCRENMKVFRFIFNINSDTGKNSKEGEFEDVYQETQSQQSHRLLWIQNQAQPQKLRDGSIQWFGILTDITKEVYKLTNEERFSSIFDLIIKERPLNEVLGKVCEYIEAEISPAKVGIYLPLDREESNMELKEKTTLELIANYNYTKSLLSILRTVTFSPSGGANHKLPLPVEIVFRQKMPLYLPNIVKLHESSDFEGREKFVASEVKSLLVIPIKNINNKVIAVLEILMLKPNIPDPFQNPFFEGRSGVALNKFLEKAIQITQTAIEKSRIEGALKSNETNLKVLFETAPIGICETTNDNEKKILFANRTFCETICTPEENPPFGIPLKDILLKEPKDEILIDKTGKDKIYLSVFRQEIQKPDSSSSIVFFFSDISSEKSKQDTLIREKAIAERANKAKSEFLAAMSHEIRTPMNAILGYAEMLKSTPLNDDQKRFVQTMESSGNILLKIISDILNLSKIEAGKMTIEEEPMLVEETIQQIAQCFELEAKKKNLSLIIRPPKENIPRAIKTDKEKVKQILFNLASNAIKFTEKGAVSFHIRYEGESKSEYGNETPEGKIFIEVIDTGIGIAAEKQHYLFQPFSQIHNESGTGKKYPSTGLGLAISRKLATLLGGNIHCFSIQNQGSTFTLELPAKLCSPEEIKNILIQQNQHSQEQESSEEENLPPLRILVAEDDPTNRQLLKELLLTQKNLEVETVNNGLQAVEATIAREEPFDVLFMDVQMPEMDGIQATEIIRNNLPPTKPQPIIIALSANAFSENKTQCLQAKMDDFLTKPIRFQTLKNTLRNIQLQKLKNSQPPPNQSQKKENFNGHHYKKTKEIPELDESIIEPLIAILPKLINDAKSENLQKIETLEKSRNLPNYLQIRKEILHSLQGSSANLGLKKFSLICKKISKTENNIPQNEAKVLKKLFNTAIAALENYLSSKTSQPLNNING